MKAKFYFLSCLLLISVSVTAQWSPRANFPGTSRAKSTSFTIGNNIYVLGGVAGSGLVLGDFWEYDITANSWSQLPNFPGPERYAAVGFVINGNGYIATGGNDFGYLDDLWEYFPTTNTWLQRTGLPVTTAQHENQRREAFAFVIGNKAYLGGGDGWVFGANSTNNYAFPDLWEYDPSNNSWTSKSGFPDFFGRDLSIGVSMNGKGYVGLGCNVDETINYQTFWEYKPLTDTWTPLAAFPSLYTTDANAFVLDSVLYVTGGVKFNPLGLSSQFYKYDPITDTWIQLAAFNGGAIAGAFSASDGTRAFIGGGYTGSLNTRNDVWEITATIAGIPVDNLQPDNLATIYPNPSRGMIYLRSQKEISSVEIYDVAGNEMLHENGNLRSIDISGMSVGVYSVKVIFVDGGFSFMRIGKINR